MKTPGAPFRLQVRVQIEREEGRRMFQGRLNIGQHAHHP